MSSLPGTARPAGVRVPNGRRDSRRPLRLTICDATSAASRRICRGTSWNVDDVQLGRSHGRRGRAGMLIRAPARWTARVLHAPHGRCPRIFRMTKGGKLIEGIFVGETINTPSMLGVRGLPRGAGLAKSIGGLADADGAGRSNAHAIFEFHAATATARAGLDRQSAAEDRATRSNTSGLPEVQKPMRASPMARLSPGGGQRLGSRGWRWISAPYRDAPAGLRIWCGLRRWETGGYRGDSWPWLDWRSTPRIAAQAEAA